VLSFFLVLLCTSSSLAQQRDTEEKNEFAAAGLEFVVPVLGHAYVGDPREGLPPALVSAGGLTLAIIGTQVGCEDEFLGECINEGNVGLMWAGILGYVGGRIWGIVSAMELAQEHNAQLRRRGSVAIYPARDRINLRVSYAIP